jgi:hypothetical protein
MAQENKRKIGRIRIPLNIPRISWRDVAVTLVPILLLSLFAIWLALRLVRPAPPDTIIITTGPDGSQFQNTAERYKKILARNNIKLEILPSPGGLENLKRLIDPNFRVDVGLVQGGIGAGLDTDELVSLGSVFYQPVMVFYRSAEPLNRLSALKGKRLAIGAEGSGARALALNLLKANGIEPDGPTRLLPLSGDAAVQHMLGGKIDAAMLMGDTAVSGGFRKLLGAPGVRLLDFAQADGYMRRFRYLSKLELPPGSLDLGRNIPEKTLNLIAPTVELVARPDLHPALSDLLIEAAREVHGRGGLLQRPGEFPAPLEHEYRISDDAARFYKSGKGFLYRYLPFWLANLVDRTMVALVPIIVLMIPALRLAPWLYSLRIRARIYRRYGELMAVERALLSEAAPEEQEKLLKRVDDIEKSIISVRMPSSFADEVYVLRAHINFVRNRLAHAKAK